MITMITALLMAVALPEAIEQVESSGRASAVGDGGKAVGALQIHPIVLAEVNARHGTNFSLEDRTNPNLSKAVFKLYTQYWVSKARRKGATGSSDELAARIWNGGPNGWTKASTLKYWEKVKKEMNKQ